MANRIRRRIAASALALAAPLALAQQPTIEVGVLTIGSGSFATCASLVESGAKTAAESLDAEGGALGGKFRSVVQSHSGTPHAALAAPAAPGAGGDGSRRQDRLRNEGGHAGAGDLPGAQPRLQGLLSSRDGARNP